MNKTATKKEDRVLYEDASGYDWDGVEWNALNKTLDRDIDRMIVAVATLDLWNGTRWGWKCCGSNLRSILSCTEDFNIWTVGKDVVLKAAHHDGTNTIVFRKLRKGTSESFIWKLQNGNTTVDELLKHTASLSADVAAAMGW